MKNLKQAVSYLLITSLMALSLPAHADFVGTEQMLAQDARTNARATVDSFLAREQVVTQLEAWGVAPTAVSERVAALSETELQQLASSIDGQPAGGSLIGVIGVVFVVLLILELVGVINIFH